MSARKRAGRSVRFVRNGSPKRGSKTNTSPVSKVYGYDPYDQLDAGERKAILGVQANLWTEYISSMPHVEYMVLPRMAAMAENGWSYDRKDYDDFVRRMQSLRRIYDLCGFNYAKHIFIQN